MKTIALMLSLLLLTSCSSPDTSGGVTLSRGGDDANEFPYGGCEGQGKNPTGGRTGCGWIHVYEESYYIMPFVGLIHANLRDANLRDANLRYSNLHEAILSGADLSGTNLFGANLRDAYLIDADLSGADLRDANLRGARLWSAYLAGVKANSSTICPNGIRRGTAGNDCGF